MSNNNREYVSDIKIIPTGLKVKSDTIFDYAIHYDTHSKNCYIAYISAMGSGTVHKGLTPFISPNGSPYKFDEKLKKLYY